MLKWFRRQPKATPAALLGAIEIHEPWARAASMAPRQGGGFLTLINTGAEADRLLAARSPDAERIEIHAIKVMGPDVKMQRRPDGLAVPAGTTITLRPRGYHLLLIGLAAPLKPGARLPVTLVFDKAGTIDIELAVVAPGPVGIDALDEEAQRG